MHPNKTYKSYLTWFDTKLQTPEGISELRRSKACENPYSSETPTPYTYGFWCMYSCDEEQLREVAERKITRNREFITKDSEFVWTPSGKQKINPEYRARAIATKELIGKLKAYSGDSGLASDLLFNFKKEADLYCTDFTQVAREQKSILEGHGVTDSTPRPSIPIPGPLSKQPTFLKRLFKFLFHHGYSDDHEPRRSYMEWQEIFRRSEEK